MDEKNYLGWICRDKITSEEGTCTAKIESMFGPTQYIFEVRNKEAKVLESERLTPIRKWESREDFTVEEDVNEGDSTGSIVYRR